jgi:hypothetical protein
MKPGKQPIGQCIARLILPALLVALSGAALYIFVSMDTYQTIGAIFQTLQPCL